MYPDFDKYSQADPGDLELVQPGTLYLVPTPIGNYGDLSSRALSVLRGVDAIFCEDTRVSGLLTSHFHFKPKFYACHEYNEEQRIKQILQLLEEGQALALISDAGCPIISDPGYLVVRAVRASGFQIKALPGPNAALTALMAAGLPATEFLFMGFLPKKGQARKAKLSFIASFPYTVLLYESPYRIGRTLEDLAALGQENRPLCLARELTKRYEEFYHFTLAEALKALQKNQVKLKGEFVIILGPPADPHTQGESSDREAPSYQDDASSQGDVSSQDDAVFPDDQGAPRA